MGDDIAQNINIFNSLLGYGDHQHDNFQFKIEDKNAPWTHGTSHQRHRHC